MPPRYAYWTIIAGGLPTAFRAAEREELLPTFARIQAKHPDAEMKYFARGKLWPSQEEAQREIETRRAAAAERESARGRTSRGRDWRPGGEHRDPRQKFKDAKKDRNLEGRKRRFEHRQKPGMTSGSGAPSRSAEGPEWRGRPPGAGKPQGEWRGRPPGADKSQGEWHGRPPGATKPQGEWRGRPPGAGKPQGEWRGRPPGAGNPSGQWSDRPPRPRSDGRPPKPGEAPKPGPRPPKPSFRPAKPPFRPSGPSDKSRPGRGPNTDRRRRS